MARRKAIKYDEPEICVKPVKRYKIKDGKDEGFGRFHLYCEGDWLESFHTEEAALAEEAARKVFDQTF